MNKKQLYEALAVLLTKLSSARDNPLLMDNYAVKALSQLAHTKRDSSIGYDLQSIIGLI